MTNFEQEPASPASPAPAAPPPPPAAQKVGGLALAALLVGLGAFLVGLVPVFGAMVGITGGVLGAIALTKRQSKGMAIAGIVLGSIAFLSSIGMTIGFAAVGNHASNQFPPAALSDPPASAAPVAPTEAPAEKTPEPQAPAVPAEYKSALTKATSYSDIMYMSKAGIYDQLVSEYGEQFTPEAAQYAIDNVQADWNANALAKAKSYQENMAMSPAAIHDQLTSAYGEQFTAAEADYAIQHLND